MSYQDLRDFLSVVDKYKELKRLRIIDACQPFEWKDGWYPVAISSPELRRKILDKYGAVLKGLL